MSFITVTLPTEGVSFNKNEVLALFIRKEINPGSKKDMKTDRRRETERNRQKRRARKIKKRKGRSPKDE
jgi:hypothetical protein